MRVAASKTSPLSDTIELLINEVDDSVVESVVASLLDLVKGIGMKPVTYVYLLLICIYSACTLQVYKRRSGLLVRYRVLWIRSAAWIAKSLQQRY